MVILLNNKEKVLERILEHSCSAFSLKKLSERRNEYGAKFVVGTSSEVIEDKVSTLHVGINGEEISYIDVPAQIREGVISFRSSTLRGFLEKFLARELPYTTIPFAYNLPRRVCIKRDSKIPGHSWDRKKNLNSDRPGYAVIYQHIEKTRYLPDGEKLYHFLNSPAVREACVELGMPSENPDEEYIGEHARPYGKIDRPSLKQIWCLVAKAIVTRGKHPKEIPSNLQTLT